MLKLNCSRCVAILLCGLLLAGFFLLKVACRKKSPIDYTKLIGPGVFGDISIGIGKPTSSGKLEYGALGKIETLTILKNKHPFIVILKDSSNDVKRFVITDDMERALAVGDFEEGKISRLAILDNEQREVFMVISADEPNLWQRGQYGRFNHASELNEWYMDIDFNGSMDAKFVVGQDGGVFSRYIFIDKMWKEMDWCVPHDGQAYLKTDSEKAHYDFEFGKGWKKRLE